MASYELTYIARADVDDAGLTALMDRVSTMIQNAGGTVLNRKILGKRRLAYPIKKVSEGTYIYLALSLPQTQVRTIERNLTLNDAVLRSLVVRVEEDELILPEPPAATPAPEVVPEAPAAPPA